MAEWVQGDKMTVALMNQKTVYIGAAAPATPYDGQVWNCTSSNPPLVKSYDLTNTRWQEHHEARYETVNSGQTPISGVYLNGTLCVAYDTELSGTKLYGYANNSWRDMGGTLVRAYPFGAISSMVNLVNGAAVIGDIGVGTGPVVSGEIKTILSTNINPTTSGCTVVIFAGGIVSPTVTTHKADLLLKIGTETVFTVRTSGGWNTYSLLGFQNGIGNTSTNISLQLQSRQSGSLYIYGGASLAALSVET